jgi:hypothetical protein
MVHHVFWSKEVEHRIGFENTLEVMAASYGKNLGAQLTRLGKLLGFTLTDGVSDSLLSMPKEKLAALIEDLSVNWLAGDGIWFQAVESKCGMFDAKRCNDFCWAWFSPFEAWSIKRILNLPERAGIEGLKKALALRLYAHIDEQSIACEGPDRILLRMNNCPVQAARKNKGMEDCLCKSAGLVEYANFARTIDPGIETECVGCPPDGHPDEWFCAWRFSLD